MMIWLTLYVAGSHMHFTRRPPLTKKKTTHTLETNPSRWLVDQSDHTLLTLVSIGNSKEYATIIYNKIHLWRHSIVLALHYFQGMACYRSATLLEVMDTRLFETCLFSLESNTGKVVFLKYIQTNHVSQWIKKVGGDSSSRTHAV